MNDQPRYAPPQQPQPHYPHPSMPPQQLVMQHPYPAPQPYPGPPHLQGSPYGTLMSGAPTNGYAIAGLVFGIVGLVIGIWSLIPILGIFAGIIGFVPSVLGIIFGHIGVSRSASLGIGKTQGRIGLILGYTSIGIMILTFLGWMLVLAGS